MFNLQILSLSVILGSPVGLKSDLRKIVGILSNGPSEIQEIFPREFIGSK